MNQQRFDKMMDTIMATALIAVTAGTICMMLYGIADNLLCEPRDGAVIVLPNTGTAGGLLCPTGNTGN